MENTDLHTVISQKQYIQPLKKKKIIDELFHEGSSLVIYPLRLIFLKIFFCQPNQFPQVVFCISKKKIKSACKRNRIKRQMKEIYRLHKKVFINNSMVRNPAFMAIVYTTKNQESYHTIMESLMKLLQQISNQYQFSSMEKKYF